MLSEPAACRLRRTQQLLLAPDRASPSQGWSAEPAEPVNTRHPLSDRSQREAHYLKEGFRSCAEPRLCLIKGTGAAPGRPCIRRNVGWDAC